MPRKTARPARTGRAKAPGTAGPAGSGWSIRLLGEPALVSPQGGEHLLERRAAALLALAFLEPSLSRRRAAMLLWPDSEESNARQALRQQLLRMKKLGGALVDGAPALRLAREVAVDLAGVGSGGRLLGAFEYADCEELARWVGHQRERLHRVATERLERELEVAEADGDLDVALEAAHQLLAADPDNERNHRNLMRLHYLRGDAAQAQSAYDRLRASLAQEFGVAPSRETEQLARIIRSARTDRAAFAVAGTPPALARPPRLVGREREWQALESCWQASAAALVTGVAGMGKTRLVTDFVANRAEVELVAARPGDAFAPYSLLARLVRALVRRIAAPLPPGLRSELARLLPELGEAPPIRDAADQSRLQRAVEALLDRALEGGLEGVVIDDLHHADAASIEAIQATFAAERRLHVIATGRGDELSHEGRALADALVSSNAGRPVELAPLTQGQVADLLDSLDLPGFDGATLAADIARHTGGNPLFVLETVKAMLLGETLAKDGGYLPAAGNVTALIERRLGRLSTRAVQIARCAAVAGQDLSVELVAHVMGLRPLDLADAWAELEKAQVLRDGAFAHDLVHEAARASVPAAIARRLHAEIAQFLASCATEPARVAGHWLEARRHAEASAAFLQAAERARAAGRHIEEANLLGEAAACFERGGDREAGFEALLRRAEAMVVVDLGEAALAAVRAAEGAARTDEQRLRALLRKADFLGNRSDSEAAIDAGRAGIALARKSRRKDLVAHFSLIVAGGLCELRRVDEALAILEPYRAGAEAELAPRARAEYFIQLGIALDLANRLGDALVAFERARDVAVTGGFRDLLATALSNLATTTSKRGELHRAVEFGRQGLQLWRESEALKGTPLQTQALLAHRLRDIGHYAEAIAMLEEALAEFRRAGTRHWIFATAHRLALAYAHLGQHARALELLAEDPAGLPAKARAIWIAHRAEVARLAGGSALKPIRTALSLLGDDVDDGNNRLVSLFASAIVSPTEGEPMATAVAAWAEARERFGMAVAAHARSAGCALAQGAIDRALPHVEAALRLFTDHEPDNFYRPELWWVASRVFAAAGRAAPAKRMLADGRAWVMDVADCHVPADLRDGFLQRNPVNRSLLGSDATAGIA